jgi:hypothetical protein
MALRVAFAVVAGAGFAIGAGVGGWLGYWLAVGTIALERHEQQHGG